VVDHLEGAHERNEADYKKYIKEEIVNQVNLVDHLAVENQKIMVEAAL
jgi:hypothetical protein